MCAVYRLGAGLRRGRSGGHRCRDKDCGKDFSIASGALFTSHKMKLGGYLAAIAIFCNEVKGKSMLALSRDPGRFKTEGQAVSWIKPRRQEYGTPCGRSASWNDLRGRFRMKRIDHHTAHSLDGACTDQAESYVSRLRRSEMGHHHHIAGPYLLRYAQESAWREDNRRIANGDQVLRVVGLALGRGKSVDFSGCWQRHVKVDT